MRICFISDLIKNKSVQSRWACEWFECSSEWPWEENGHSLGERLQLAPAVSNRVQKLIIFTKTFIFFYPYRNCLGGPYSEERRLCAPWHSCLPPGSPSSEHSLHLTMWGDNRLFKGSKASKKEIFFRMYHRMLGLIMSNVFRDRIVIETF